MKSECPPEPTVSVLRAVSPVWRLRRLVRDLRLLGLRFGFRHWRLQNRIDNEHLLRFLCCVRCLGWRFGRRYWRIANGRGLTSSLSAAAFRPDSPGLGGLRTQLRRAESRLTAVRDRIRNPDDGGIGDRTSRA